MSEEALNQALPSFFFGEFLKKIMVLNIAISICFPIIGKVFDILSRECNNVPEMGMKSVPPW